MLAGRAAPEGLGPPQLRMAGTLKARKKHQGWMRAQAGSQSSLAVGGLLQPTKKEEELGLAHHLQHWVATSRLERRGGTFGKGSRIGGCRGAEPPALARAAENFLDLSETEAIFKRKTSLLFSTQSSYK